MDSSGARNAAYAISAVSNGIRRFAARAVFNHIAFGNRKPINAVPVSESA